MKDFTKILLILAAVCLTIGLGFTFAGITMGATMKDLNHVEENQFPGKMGQFLEKTGVFIEEYMESDWDSEEDEYEETCDRDFEEREEESQQSRQMPPVKQAVSK